jgi:CubicO group peptidase (beta-lactamase class C family)
MRTIHLATLALLAALPSGGAAQVVLPGSSPATDSIALPSGSIDRAIDELPGMIDAIMASSGVPGMAVAVVHGGETLFLQGFGVRDVRTMEPVTPGTVFQIASISKPVTSTVAAIAVSRGQVAWDDPIVTHLPDFRLSDELVTRAVTIGDMFAHRSGLPHAAGDDLEDLGFGRDEILARLWMHPADDFRTSYNYANFGTTTGAEAIAAAVGIAWESLAADYLYEPLGMTATSSRFADFIANPERATPHAFEDGRFQPLYQRNPDPQSPAGGVSSSAADMAVWMKLLLADGALDGRTLFEQGDLLPALLPQVTSAPARRMDARSAFYGYGFNHGITPGGRTIMSHSGAFLLGAATHFQLLPSEDLGIVVLSNGAPVGAVEAVAAQFMDVVQFGAPIRDWYGAYNSLMRGLHEPVGDLAAAIRPNPPWVPTDPDAYAGHYGNPYFGAAIVESGATGVSVTLGPEGQRFALEPWSPDVFALTPRGENAPAGSRSSVRFDLDDGTLTIDYLDRSGLGTWTRSGP